MNQNWKLPILMLREIANAKSIGQEELKEKTGISQKGISNIFNLKTTPKLDSFAKIAEALGVKFFIEGDSELNMELIYKNALAKFEKEIEKGSEN